MFDFSKVKGVAPIEEVRAPRISVNKLAEYLEASTLRRKKIVQDAKYPSPILTTRYATAKEVIIEYFETKNPDVLQNGLAELAGADVSTDFKKNDVKNQIEVLNRILEMEFGQFENLNLARLDHENPLLSINGINVSVNPDILIEGTIKKKEVFGAMKLSIIKTNPLSVYGQEIVALLTKDFLAEVFPGRNGVNNRLCISFDAFQQRLVACPASETNRRREVGTACEEIAQRWASL